MVMLAGQVLGSAVFCVLKFSCTIKKCEMDGTSQGRGVYIV